MPPERGELEHSERPESAGSRSVRLAKKSEEPGAVEEKMAAAAEVRKRSAWQGAQESGGEDEPVQPGKVGGRQLGPLALGSGRDLANPPWRKRQRHRKMTSRSCDEEALKKKCP